MKSLHRHLLCSLIALLLCSTAAFAANIAEMRQQMWTWSQLEAVVFEATHTCNPDYMPVVDLKEAYELIDQAQKSISKNIASITTANELAQARALAREFIEMGDKEEEVGIAVNRLLDQQEKFLQAHQL